MKDLYSIKAPHFVAAVITGYNNIIIEAAPILHWTIGKDIHEVRKWCRKKNYSLTYIETLELLGE